MPAPRVSGELRTFYQEQLERVVVSQPKDNRYRRPAQRMGNVNPDARVTG